MNKYFFCWLFSILFWVATPGFAATTVGPDCQASVKLQLQTARQKLRLSELTRKRVARELRDLKRSQQAAPAILQDYTIYLQRVQDLVDENRRLIRKMETLCTAGENRATVSDGGNGTLQSGSDKSGEAPVDEVTLLDRRLNESLASFDEMLHKRLKAIKAESARKMRDLAQQAAQAAGRAYQRGTGAVEAAKNDKDGRPVEGAARGPEGSRRDQGAFYGKKTDRRGASTGSGKSVSARGPTDRRGDARVSSANGASTDTGSAAGRAYSREDDDIVARQLREAAEQESDPELKKKLWKEYAEYKKNTRP